MAKRRGTSRQVNVHEAKTQLSRLLKEVEAGSEIIIARGGKPVAKLVSAGDVQRRPVFGLDRGKIWIADDFDDTPEEIIRLFEGSESEDPG